jgi:hypothetical protein
MTAMRSAMALLTILLASFPLALSAQTPSAVATRQADAAIRLARDFAIPRYTALAAATERQEQAWQSACAGPRGLEGSVVPLSERFRDAADAWSAVEMIRDGPIGEDLRYDRMAHWPERRNAVARALAAQMRASEEPTVERLRQASVAAQGLTALERLIFGADGAGPERAADATLRRRSCALGLAIAANLARTARETLAGWQGPNGRLATLEHREARDARETVSRFVTDALTTLEAVADVKIGLPLGKAGADSARPLLSEGWRSGRSLRAVALNLDSVATCIRLLLAGAPDAAPWLVTTAGSARRLVDEIAPATLGEAVADPKRRAGVALLRDAVRSWRLVAAAPIAEQLGVTLGFNSSDGD